MDKLYIFSQNNLYIKSKEDWLPINSIRNLLIQNFNDENLQIIENTYNQSFITNLCFNKQYIFSNIRTSMIDNNLYCEIIHSNNSKPLQKFCTKTCEVYIYNNYVEILNNNNFFDYYFCAEKNNFAIENDDIIYIFNDNNILEFDTKINSFCLKKCKKYAKNGENIEVLCKIPKNNVYFILYNFDIINNNVNKKFYKNENILLYDAYSLPIIFFYLVKNNIPDAKNFLGQNINFDELKNYLSQFDDIWEIDGEYVVSSGKQICKIKFEIKNNLIVDID